MCSGECGYAVGQTGRAAIYFAYIGFAHVDTPAPRRPVSDVYHHAAAACHAPQHNTTAGRTNKSTKVCVFEAVSYRGLSGRLALAFFVIRVTDVVLFDFNLRHLKLWNLFLLCC